jgi:hypothetical protein
MISVDFSLFLQIIFTLNVLYCQTALFVISRETVKAYRFRLYAPIPAGITVLILSGFYP